MLTITSPSDIDHLFKHARRASVPLLGILTVPTAEGRAVTGRVLFVAGRKMGGAVLRNRCKRVLREACRRAEGPWPGADVALLARAGVATASPPEIDRAVKAVLSQVGLVPR